MVDTQHLETPSTPAHGLSQAEFRATSLAGTWASPSPIAERLTIPGLSRQHFSEESTPATVATSAIPSAWKVAQVMRVSSKLVSPIAA